MGRAQEAPDGSGLSPHLQHIRPWHRSMARSVALGAARPTQLAETYGFTVGQVSRIMGTPAFQAEVARLENELDLVAMDVAKDLQLMGERALQNLDEDLNIEPQTHDQRKLRNSTSLEVLGMLGISKQNGAGTKIINNVLNVTAEKDVPESEQELR